MCNLLSLLLLLFSFTIVAAQTSNNATTKWLTLNVRQGISRRTTRFDGRQQKILMVQDVQRRLQPLGLWLNIQNDTFFRQHHRNMSNFIISLSRDLLVNYISSPEVNFLRSIVPKFDPRVTKLVFQFLGQDDVEPSTNQTYGSLLKNLGFIKAFASEILVPKSYIWPVDNSFYLQPHTSLVLDAHKEGLQIFASEFANDVHFAYNYSYDPVAEYLSFVDNGNFSVDGVLSDFPVTPSATIDCFTHLDKNDKPQAKILIITSEGASGDYPGCTNLAYTKAAMDGADVLDCPVQMTKDGIPFCLGSINLIDKTTIFESSFGNIVDSVPELNISLGIVTVKLTWDEIKSLKPVISNPWSEVGLDRNPKASNEGNFVSLVDFLSYATNAMTVSGVMISIENAAYLANQGFGVIAAVLEALRSFGYHNQTAKKVMIQSKDSSVLKEFKKSSYELVYRIADDIRDIESSNISEIKSFATSIVLTKKSVFPSEEEFLVGKTDVVQKLQSSNLPVYVQGFNNEYASQVWDFFADSSVEINSYVAGAGIDGVITDFPGTAARYRRSHCLGYKDRPPYLSPIEPGGLLQFMPPQYSPALPPIANIAPTACNESTANAAPTYPIGQSSVLIGILRCCLAILLADLLIF
ncbi:glycerophosphodiester phosphodiesterase GDPDL3-like isoform X2 [Lycium barbarum]|uniref:glycerophosphodiester phosphodiesterase GDPDL3-like isoform X2 n=1 Tax=Lycium barbarum TaxID=112863 RepID=UPI00293E85E9|nr:glycerophosphodiester phosphodiesterase GDPDL3-like isoform X2 [Lycium barbarum]